MTPKRQQLLTAAVVLACALAVGAHASGPSRELAANGAIVFASPRAPDLYGEIYSVGANGRGRRNLSRSEHADGSTTLSRDGTRVAFVSDRTGYSAIWTTTLGGRRLRRLTGRRSSGIGGLAFSPDGRRIAFGSRSGVYVVRASGGRARRIAAGGSFPSWSADGRRLAYTGGDGDRVVVVTPTGRRQWSAPGFQPLWAPSGHLLAYYTDRRDRRWIVIARANGKRLWRVRSETFLGWSPSGREFAFVVEGGTTRIGQPATRRITRLPGYVTSVSWSPDGRRLGWATGGEAVRVRTKQGNARTLPGKGFHIEWSPDGKRLLVIGRYGLSVISVRAMSRRVVASGAISIARWAGKRTIVYERYNPGFSSELWTIKPNGKGLRRLTSDGFGKFQPAWSPDGSRIAFARASVRGECMHCSFEIFVVAGNGSNPRRVCGAGLYGGSPTWSPDGRRIAFARSEGLDGPVEIFVVGADGGTSVSQLTHFGAGDPAWSPDGTLIAFASTRDGDGIYVMRADGSEVRRVAAAREPVSPTWSPDGSRVAYRTARGIAVVAVADGTVSDLRSTDRRQCSSGLAWSPDGKWLAYGDCAGSPLSSDLFAVRADGSATRHLTRDRAPDFGASWQAVPLSGSSGSRRRP
jgi:Tol biopolymer transport system component